MNRCIKKISLGLISAGLSVNTLAASFQLYSSDFIDKGGLKQAQVFNGFGCQGQNQSPALSWKNPPAGTKSFALLVHDPDAPTGGPGGGTGSLSIFPFKQPLYRQELGKPIPKLKPQKKQIKPYYPQELSR
jgi:hypothetical protein